MAAFRIGDKARIVKVLREHTLLGMECVIASGLGQDPNPANKRGAGELVYLVDVLGHPHPVWGHWSVLPWQLAPLVDDAADQFIARIKKLGSEPVNAVEKEGVK